MEKRTWFWFPRPALHMASEIKRPSSLNSEAKIVCQPSALSSLFQLRSGFIHCCTLLVNLPQIIPFGDGMIRRWSSCASGAPFIDNLRCRVALDASEPAPDVAEYVPE